MEWIRIPVDTITVYDSKGEAIGVLCRTYGVQVLEVGHEMVKIFSPDLNRNGYVSKQEIGY